MEDLFEDEIMEAPAIYGDEGSSKVLIRSLLEHEHISWIVKKEKRSKYDSMTVHKEDGPLILYRGKGQEVECILQVSPMSKIVYRYFVYTPFTLNSDKLLLWHSYDVRLQLLIPRSDLRHSLKAYLWPKNNCW